ncbi:hypothetical protein GCM10022234_27870 [Aeromicrobium panaciterrae]|uniref:lamin tail domain-containing protein n=1 Tax=Aeromicrobium panaciterrae TaxID=363861 RepID=UPI0031DC70CF
MRVRRTAAVFPAVMLALSGITVMSLSQSANAAGSADIRITEWEYNGSEFVELTNIGSESHDLTGWSFADSARTPGSVSLSAFGNVTPGESVILSEATASAFRTEWNLPATVKVVGGNTQNLGRSDEINIYDASSALVDRLTYNDQGTGDVKGPRTDTASAWASAANLGLNKASTWTRSTAGDAESSAVSAGGFIGSPGTSTLGGAPSEPNPGSPTDIKINEVSSQGVPADYVELINTGSAPIDINGWTLEDSAAAPAVIATTPTVIAPGGYLALVNGTNFPFGLGSADLVKLKTGSTLVAEYSWSAHLDPSWGRCPDGTGELKLNVTQTPGAANNCPVAPPAEPTVKINEIESNGDKVADWVELVNTGTADADVSGWKILDNDPAHVTTPVVVPANTTIPVGGHYAIYTEIAQSPGFGLGGNDSVTLFKQDGTQVDTYAWTAHAATTFGRCPDGTGDFALTTTSTRGLANACSPVRINEVESSGGDPGDWVELVNVSDAPVDLTGWTFKDSGEPGYTIPSGSIAAHGYVVLDEAGFGFGLGGADSARLFDQHGVLAESYSWTAHAATTYGRCKDALGDFTTTVAPTKGTVNTCPGLNTDVWPGDQVVHTSDLESTFVQDLSGLAFDPSDPGVLWAAQNKKGTLFKLVREAGSWVPAAGWPRDPKYPNGSGAPDTEGITIGPDGTVYLASERNNDASGVSRSSILSYDPNGSGLTATHEWDVTGLIPANGANLGLEGVTWIPDSYLTGNGFKDENTGQAYDPADYPLHGTGVFAVAVEDSGNLHLFALPSDGGAPTRLATVASGFPHLADVSFDPERQRLWAVTDDTHDGKTSQLKISGGAFVIDTAYDRPAGMPNINNEGLAISLQSTCVDGKKEVVWADDGDTDGHSLRSGTIVCTALPHDPKITADVAGTQAPSGWYRSDVTVTFTCTPQGSPLAGSCPAPVVLTASAVDQTVTGTISSVDGGTASVTVDNIDIDKVPPTVSLGDAPDPKKYAGPLPKPTCQGSDALSGIDTCTVTESHPSGLTTVFTAKAVDRAGNESSKPITYATLKVTTFTISFAGLRPVITPVTKYIVIPRLF